MRIALRIAIVAALLALGAGTATAEIRVFAATLTGTQEVPPVAVDAGGGAVLSLDTDTKMVSYSVVYTGITTETAAHIHGPAPVGVNADVLFPLPLGSPKIGVIGPLTDQQVADLNNGLYYVNVHTTAHSGGAIRGQISLVIAVAPTTWSHVKALYEH